jgi:hypothetical protein
VRYLRIAFSLACVGGCAGGAKPAEPIGAPKGHVAGTICGASPRGDDRCGVVRDPFDTRDVDGCPDVAIEYAGGEEAPVRDPAPTLGDLAAEMKRMDALADVSVIAVAAPGEERALIDRRIAGITRELARLGVEPRRLSRAYQTAEHGDGYVFFEPYACRDGACASWECVRARRRGN